MTDGGRNVRGPLSGVLAEIGRPQDATAGEVLLREGEDADRVLSIVAGRVKVTARTARGPAAVLGFRGPGDVVGETGALGGGPRIATVTAVEPVRYLAADAAAFRRHLLQRPELALALAVELGTRLGDAGRRSVEHSSGDTTARVAARLAELAEQFGVDGPAGTRIALPLTQDELAGFTGSSVEAVAKALRTLRTAGWVDTGRREITVRDLPALTARSRG